MLKCNDVIYNKIIYFMFKFLCRIIFKYLLDFKNIDNIIDK